MFFIEAGACYIIRLFGTYYKYYMTIDAGR